MLLKLRFTYFTIVQHFDNFFAKRIQVEVLDPLDRRIATATYDSAPPATMALPANTPTHCLLKSGCPGFTG
jgi:hypothetical protein